MKAKIRKIGNSAGIIFNKHDMGKLNVKIGESVEINAEKKLSIDYDYLSDQIAQKVVRLLNER